MLRQLQSKHKLRLSNLKKSFRYIEERAKDDQFLIRQRHSFNSQILAKHHTTDLTSIFNQTQQNKNSANFEAKDQEKSVRLNLLFTKQQSMITVVLNVNKISHKPIARHHPTLIRLQTESSNSTQTTKFKNYLHPVSQKYSRLQRHHQLPKIKDSLSLNFKDICKNLRQLSLDQRSSKSKFEPWQTNKDSFNQTLKVKVQLQLENRQKIKCK